MLDAPMILFVVAMLALFLSIEMVKAIHAPRRSRLDRFTRFERPLTKYEAERLEKGME